ncbi:MAG: FHA domain-containing protein [Myxococcaceae bacterium]|nr:FHA domain-containing protein [Myxococcaceae bacterium]
MIETLWKWLSHYMEDPGGTQVRLGGRPVIVFSLPEEKESQDEEWGDRFRTASAGTKPSLNGGQQLVTLLEKTKENAFQTKLTMGRTTNNDIVLNHVSVSRFHAWFQPDGSTDGWAVVDAGSKNGTILSGHKITSKKAHELQSGSKIRLGKVELTFYSPAGFVRMLKARVEHR